MSFKKLLGRLLIFSSIANVALSADLDTAKIKELGNRVAKWQINTFDNHLKYRAIATRGFKSTRKYNDLEWQMGALYTGMYEWGKVSGDQKIYDFLFMIGERNSWKLNRHRYNADDHVVGQFYLSFYDEFKDPNMLEPTRKSFDWVLTHRKTGAMTWQLKGNDCHNRWGWCDALFMAPPVWARLAKLTGEKRYLEFMDEEYHVTYDLLWDKDEQLFWRDTSYFKKRENNGKKLFWSRGNGWVFGGLALMIPDLPEKWEGKSFYIETFKSMAETLKKIQREDGTWSMGLLGGVEGYPIKDTSGTALFAFGFAWGINNGILDRETYEPVVQKGWQALEKCVTPEGLLGYVQPVGAAPGDSFPDKTEVYGIGAFLAAAAEVYKLAGGQVSENKIVLPKKSKIKAAPCFARFVPERMDDFAWENDRIAYRVYGPALWKIPKKRCSSGIDVWVKKVRYPIINKWYKRKNYHKDEGEGADLYKVGKSLGCGGLGFWVDGKLKLNAHFKSYKVISGSGDRIEFELTYAPLKVGATTITEVKRISMGAGSNFYKVKNSFTIEGADEVTVAVGVVLRKGDGKLDHGDNWLSYAEPVSKNNGQTYCGVILKQNAEFKKGDNHAMLLYRVKNGDTLIYRAAAGWSKGLDFKTYEDWNKYIKNSAK